MRTQLLKVLVSTLLSQTHSSVGMSEILDPTAPAVHQDGLSAPEPVGFERIDAPVPTPDALASEVLAARAPLAGLLGGFAGGLPPLTKLKQRVYVSSVETSIKLGKKTSVTQSVIAHKIEKLDSIKDKLAGDFRNTGGQEFTMTYQLERDLAEAAAKRIDERRGNVALNVNFVLNDHSRLIVQLVSAIAHFANTGLVSWAMLSGGRTNVVNRDKLDGRIEEGSGVLYVPRVTGDTGSSDAWYAVVGAALGCGCTVVTDATANDRNNRVSITAPTGINLIRGCMEALLRLGNVYVRANAGVVFAHALAYGIHNSLTVVAHTDEGGYMRDVWRRNRFCVPYGVVWVNAERLASIPMPVAVSIVAAARFVDSVALYVAAGSAVCDPLVLSGEDYYPSLFTAGKTDFDITLRTHTEEELAAYGAEHADKIYSACGAYCDSMSRLLDLMVMGSSEQYHLDKVSGFLQANFASLCGSHSRHLKHKSVTPFYWIEPQNLLGSEVGEFLAQREGYGVWAYKNVQVTEVPALEPGSKVMGTPSALYGDLYIPFTAARRNPLFMHLLNNVGDGLAYFQPRQTREDGLAQVGAREGNSGSFAERCRAGADLDSFLWQRATSKTIVPGEFLQLHKGLALRVSFSYYNDESGYLEMLFPGSAEELMANIKVTPRQPQGVGNKGRQKPFNYNTSRTNGLGAAALDTNRGTMATAGSPFTDMPISSSGVAYGVNVVEAEMLDPRRLIIMGDYEADAYEKFLGRVQTTVVSTKLRHKLPGKIVAAKGTQQAGGGGPTAEGGAPTSSAGTEEVGLSVREIWDKRLTVDKISSNATPNPATGYTCPEPPKLDANGVKTYPEGTVTKTNVVDFVLSTSVSNIMVAAVNHLSVLLGLDDVQTGVAVSNYAARNNLVGTMEATALFWLMVEIAGLVQLEVEETVYRDWVNDLLVADVEPGSDNEEEDDGGED